MHDLSATELSAAYRERKLSPVEVTQAVLNRIERWEPRLQATWLLNPESALAQARASEARWQRGEPLSRLDGVPS
ncbi:MAG: amidase, partial [Gammaproteobacteria bacterium]|nr:amidase [Gammaproteobacteria bacterium]